jgi:hypothetical protein
MLLGIWITLIACSTTATIKYVAKKLIRESSHALLTRRSLVSYLARHYPERNAETVFNSVVKKYVSTSRLPSLLAQDIDDDIDDLSAMIRQNQGSSVYQILDKIKVQHELLYEVLNGIFREDQDLMTEYLEERCHKERYPQETQCTETQITELVNTRNPVIYMKCSFLRYLGSKCKVVFQLHDWDFLLHESYEIFSDPVYISGLFASSAKHMNLADKVDFLDATAADSIYASFLSQAQTSNILIYEFLLFDSRGPEIKQLVMNNIEIVISRINSKKRRREEDADQELSSSQKIRMSDDMFLKDRLRTMINAKDLTLMDSAKLSETLIGEFDQSQAFNALVDIYVNEIGGLPNLLTDSTDLLQPREDLMQDDLTTVIRILVRNSQSVVDVTVNLVNDFIIFELNHTLLLSVLLERNENDPFKVDELIQSEIEQVHLSDRKCARKETKYLIHKYGSVLQSKLTFLKHIWEECGFHGDDDLWDEAVHLFIREHRKNTLTNFLLRNKDIYINARDDLDMILIRIKDLKTQGNLVPSYEEVLEQCKEHDMLYAVLLAKKVYDRKAQIERRIQKFFSKNLDVSQ